MVSSIGSSWPHFTWCSILLLIRQVFALIVFIHWHWVSVIETLRQYESAIQSAISLKHLSVSRRTSGTQSTNNWSSRISWLSFSCWGFVIWSWQYQINLKNKKTDHLVELKWTCFFITVSKRDSQFATIFVEFFMHIFNRWGNGRNIHDLKLICQITEKLLKLIFKFHRDGCSSELNNRH